MDWGCGNRDPSEWFADWHDEIGEEDSCEKLRPFEFKDGQDTAKGLVLENS
jgi:hypothetical protein